jgi:hypothetical protein
MAWIYLAESAESPWLLTSGSDLSPTVKVIDTHKASFCLGCKELYSQCDRSGTTCGLYQGAFFQAWTLSTEASHARTSALRAAVEVWEESEADFSSRSSASWKRLTRPLSSSKTFPQFELEDFRRLSVHLPIFGMTVAGRVYLPQRLEPRILGKDGSYLPTPAAQEAGTNHGGGAGRVGKVRPSLSTMARKNLWPTPTATEGAKGGPGRRYGNGDMGLSAAVIWRTPTARDGESRGPMSPERCKELGQSIHLHDQVGGQLNPRWVEWLMGYPLEWTVLEDWAMQWFRSKRSKRSKG